jgi:hypothetical protein
MKASLSLFMGAHAIGLAGAQQQQQCSPRNSCNRAVLGWGWNSPDQAERLSDCRSAMRATLGALATRSTTLTIDTTVFVTATTTSTLSTATTLTGVLILNRDADLDRRQAGATIPPYAAVCGNMDEYRSACSCMGITATTTTVTGARSTRTATTTRTRTSARTTTTLLVRPTVFGCPPGLTLCNGACVDVRTDPDNCGRCGNACPGGECGNGFCPNPSCTTPSACTAQRCNAPRAPCFCVAGVEGNFCAAGFYGSCLNSPQCATSADCPDDGVCVLAGSSCCAVNVCFRVGTFGSTCDNARAPARLFGTAAAVARNKTASAVSGDKSPAKGDTWPLRLSRM